jgi:hypothetical protein
MWLRAKSLIILFVITMFGNEMGIVLLFQLHLYRPNGKFVMLALQFCCNLHSANC